MPTKRRPNRLRRPRCRACPRARRGGTPGAHPDKAVDPATQALRDGLPKSLTDRVDVRVNDKLDGNSVHVIPDPRGPGHGVRVEVGPHATPTDVLLHAHTIQTMRRYQGLLGKLRQLKDWFNLTTVGSAGGRPGSSSEKLPGIVHERMQRLAEGGLTPEAHTKLVDEINHLSGEIDKYRKVLDTPELRDAPGRGFVAMSSKITGPDIEGVPYEGVDRTPKGMRKAELTLIDDSPLNKEHAAVYQIGHEWQEQGRIYRRLVVHDPRNNIAIVHDEIALVDPTTMERTGGWQKRGSESSGKHGGGVVGEKASWRTVKEGRFEGIVDKDGMADAAAAEAAAGTRRVQIKEKFLRNESNNGFDGVFLRINEDGSATLVVVEAKNQPSGLTKDSFTAVVGDQFNTNLDKLRKTLDKNSAAVLGLSPKDRALMIAALSEDTLNIEIQIHTTPETNSWTSRASEFKHPGAHRDQREGRESDQPHQGRPRADGSEDHGKGAERSAGTRRHWQTVGAPEAAGGRSRQRDFACVQAGRVDDAGGTGIHTGSRSADERWKVHRRRRGRIRSAHARRARGQPPEPSKVARQVLDRIRTATDKGILDKTRIILDLTHLNAAERLEVLQILKDNPKAVGAAQSILIHDRADHSMMVSTPRTFHESQRG